MPLYPPRMPAHTPLRPALTGAVVASLAVVLLLAGYAALRHPAAPVPLDVAARGAPVQWDEGFPDDFASWPLERGAVGMFLCRPGGTAPADTGSSVVVWTDAANNVVAFGGASQSGTPPAHARALGVAGALDTTASIQAAGGGHLVRTRGAQSSLLVDGAELGCIRNWDD